MKKLYYFKRTGGVSLIFLFLTLLLSSYVTAQTMTAIDGTNPQKWVTWLTNPANLAKNFVNDAPDATGKEDVFQNAKDPLDLDEWQWTISTTSDKTDLTNAGAIIVVDDVLYFMGDLVQTSGDAMIGFWVLLNGSMPMPDYSFYPAHAEGDLLVLIKFVNGGLVPVPELWEWTGGALVQLPAGSLDAFSATNVTEQPVPVTPPTWPYEPWKYTGKGAPEGYYAPTAFFEGYVDLGDLAAEWDLCNATFLMETRNSASISAALADFVWGTFNMTPDPPVALPVFRCGPGTVTLTASSTEGTLFKWYSDEALTTKVGEGASWVTGSLNMSTDYWVTVTNANECESAGTKVTVTIINVTLGLTKTDVKCFGETNGTITATFDGGTAPYMAKLDGGGWATVTSPKLFEGLAKGDHTVWVKDANNCEKSMSITIGEPTVVTLGLGMTGVLCFGDQNGTVTATFSGGTPPYMAKIDGGTYATVTSPKVFTGLAAGLHTVMVKDANNCEKSAEITVTTPPVITLTLAKADVVCFGDMNGTVTATFSGGTPPYMAKIDGGTYAAVTSPKLFTGLAAGEHTVMVKDDKGCEKSATITVGTPTVVSLDLVKTDVKCFGDQNGTVTATFSGGTAPHKVKIDAGNYETATSPKLFSGLAAGSHSVWVMDAHGCVASKTITVGTPTVLTLSLAKTDVICFGDLNGKVTATFSGGTAPYTAKIGTGTYAAATSPKDFTGLAAGSHSVWVMDANGCIASKTIEVGTPEKLVCRISDILPAECKLINGSAKVNVTGGTVPYTYLWDNGETTAVAVKLSKGLHSVIVTDKNKCTTKCEVEIPYEPCKEFCTYTQGFFGSQKGNACNLVDVIKGDAFTAGLLAKGDLKIGAGANYILFKAGDAAIIRDILPGGGGSSVLKGMCTPSANLSCLDPYLSKLGRLRNGLLAQTLVLGLNLRITEGLDEFPLETGMLTTQKKAECEKGSAVVEMVCEPVYDASIPPMIIGYTMKVNPYWYYELPEGVLCLLDDLGYDLTVGGLFKLANDALGDKLMLPAECGDFTLNLSDIAGAVDIINNAFDECRVFVGYLDEKFACPVVPKSALMNNGNSADLMQVYPNPFERAVTFEFTSVKDVNATLEIHNMLGQKVATLLDKPVEHGVVNRIEYAPKGIVPGILYYRLVMDDIIQTGKLVYDRK